MSRGSCVLTLVLLLLSPLAWGRSAQFTPSVNAQVSAARKVAPAIGVHVLELGSGETVYSYNAATQRILASNTKIITSAAALDRLGPGYFFETEVLARGEVREGILYGDLAILGGGDPNLSGRQYQGDAFGPFREWGQALARLGIRRVEGDLFLVHGLFDSELVHPDWPRNQLTRWYEAPVAALSFNDNCVLVRVEPASRAGASARVTADPPLPLFQVESSASTTSRGSQQWLDIDRKQSSGEENTLTVRGRIYQRSDPIDKWVTVADPVTFFGTALREALREEGVEVTGRLVPAARLARSDAVWRRVLTHRTDLLTVLEVVNKRSQNFYAESVLKLLGAEQCGDGSWLGGARAVREFLDELGLVPGSYQFADGSGMSRNNRFTPEQITQILRAMFGHPWGAEYVRTLPTSGERGLRWARRLADPPYRGNVMAKTGYLSGVSTLSGYAKARSGKIYAFSILMNSIRTDRQAKAAQDRIVRAVIDHG